MARLSAFSFAIAFLLIALPLSEMPAQQSVSSARMVQRNIDGALDMLAKRDISHLTPSQRAKRAWVVAELRRYQAAAAFPENRHFPGDNVPYFVDRTSGAICAVGHLMAASGRRDLVDRIADNDNNVWVLELAADAEVGAWLEEHGLTLSEAARIQAPYIGEMPASRTTVNSAETFKMIGAVGVASAGLIANAFLKPGNESRARGIIGMTGGLLAVGIGLDAASDRGTRGIGATTALLGSLSVLSSATTFSRLAANERVRVAPIIPTRREEGAGVSFSISF